MKSNLTEAELGYFLSVGSLDSKQEQRLKKSVLIKIKFNDEVNWVCHACTRSFVCFTFFFQKQQLGSVKCHLNTACANNSVSTIIQNFNSK